MGSGASARWSLCGASMVTRSRICSSAVAARTRTRPHSSARPAPGPGTTTRRRLHRAAWSLLGLRVQVSRPMRMNAHPASGSRHAARRAVNRPNGVAPGRLGHRASRDHCPSGAQSTDGPARPLARANAARACQVEVLRGQRVARRAPVDHAASRRGPDVRHHAARPARPATPTRCRCRLPAPARACRDQPPLVRAAGRCADRAPRPAWPSGRVRCRPRRRSRRSVR